MSDEEDFAHDIFEQVMAMPEEAKLRSAAALIGSMTGILRIAMGRAVFNDFMVGVVADLSRDDA